MGFMVGFMDQYNKIEDKKERREALSEQLRVKRMETLMGLRAAAGKRSGVASDETSAAQALAARYRLPNGEIIEGGEAALNSIIQAGGASMVMGDIKAREAKGEGNVIITPQSLVDNYSVYYDGDSPQVSLPTAETIFTTDYGSDTDAYLREYGALTEAATRPKRDPVLDVSAGGVYAASRENLAASKELYEGLLADRVGSMITSGDTATTNTELVSAYNTMTGEKGLAKDRARRELMLSREGIEAYHEMMEESALNPSYGYIGAVDVGAFGEVKRLWQATHNWMTYSPEAQANVISQHPFMAEYMKDLYGK